MSEHLQGTLSLDMREHAICFILPVGSVVVSASIDLPGGALIQGRFRGKIICRTGSLIIGPGAEFVGNAEAERIYVEGRVTPGVNGDVSTLLGRQLVAISESADGSADLAAQAFSIHTKSFSARIKTLPRGG